VDHRLSSNFPLDGRAATCYNGIKMTNTMTFAAEFSSAFASAPGARNNYVLLADLRAALPQYDRATFDLALRALRVAKAYSLDSADGRHVALTPAQRAAGIQECGDNLVYCARR
jgi:hypothetical protein